ncbi:MAG TPA: gephyrin-like molybdotransferase Glp, partial [Gemmatimonadaceae bacterium]|nr:gephyrin-like molybdotransferase Glp [Gemmatimonadaceae bacterium]
MDGYAVRAADVAEASAERPVRLRVRETIAAGTRPTGAVGPGEAARIMTGAPVPEGADTVIRVEDTDAGTAEVLVRDARDAHRNVRPRGEDVRAGETVLRAGTLLSAAHLGVLASVGCARPLVARRPRVAILSTGDELVDVDAMDAVRAGERIVNSNAYTIAALVREAGGEPTELGVARDDPGTLRETIERAREHDLLVTTGGVSAGAFDYTRDVLRGMGVEIVVTRVRIRPGAPTAFARLGAMAWLGLPGNPVSAMVTFELFGRPLLRALAGAQRPFRRAIPVRLAEAVTITPTLTHFLRVVLEDAGDDGLPRARMTGPQGSGLLTSMARADALLVVPAGRERYEAGERLGALPLGDGAAFGERLSLQPT